jgi:hypothetical protein
MMDLRGTVPSGARRFSAGHPYLARWGGTFVPSHHNAVVSVAAERRWALSGFALTRARCESDHEPDSRQQARTAADRRILGIGILRLRVPEGVGNFIGSWRDAIDEFQPSN